jgi:hypothetical protein
MLRWILLAVAVVVLTAAVPLILSALPADPASLTPVPVANRDASKPLSLGKAFIVGEPLHDFGKASTHTQDSHAFTVKNIGTGPLRLLPGTTTCQCTVANFENDKEKKGVEVPPGQSTTITLKWDTKEKAGPFEQIVSVQSSDPASPELFFTIKGQVSPAIVTMPQDPTFDVASIDNDKPLEIRLAMTSLDRPDFKVTGITSSRPESLDARTEPLTDEEKAQLSQNPNGFPFTTGHKLLIDVKPSESLGRFAEEIVVATDHPKQPELRVSVSGRRVGPISSVPESVRIEGRSSAGGKGSALLFVREHDTTRFEVAEKPEGLSVAIEPASASADARSKRYRIAFTIEPGTPAGVLQGDLVLTTDHPRAHTVRIPVTAVVLGDE